MFTITQLVNKYMKYLISYSSMLSIICSLFISTLQDVFGDIVCDKDFKKLFYYIYISLNSICHCIVYCYIIHPLF